MSLLTVNNLSKSFGSRIIFENLSFSLFPKEKIGLIGPNGAGKSTLLKILSSIEGPDSGEISKRKNIKIGYVEQESDFPKLSIKEILLNELKDESLKDFEKEHLAEVFLSKVGFTNFDINFEKLSGGWQKRLSIAKELMKSPDILLLDEPTNHLDIEGLLWLEKFLMKNLKTYIFVSHDRYFLQNAANRIIEISPSYPNGIFSQKGSFLNFLENKQGFLEGQLEQERSLKTKARQEENWLKKSPKARTTKSKSRIDKAYELFENLSNVKKRNLKNVANIDFESTNRKTNKLIVVQNILKKFKDFVLFKNLDFVLTPNTRIGLVGPNGSGKTTLLKILSKKMIPDQGSVKWADNLKVVYFDQHRKNLSGDISLKDALSPGGDFVTFRGKEIHVNGWAQRFLFSKDILQMPIKNLSGGERARITIANLLIEPADVLLLDEPTNDLDIPTLEVLEENLLDFPGAVVLITHDRCMIDRVCNFVLGLGDIENNQLYADYSQYEKALDDKICLKKQVIEKNAKKTIKKKLSYMESKELENMESKISKLENELKNINDLLLKKNVQNDSEKLQKHCKEASILECKIDELYLRWDDLEKRKI